MTLLQAVMGILALAGNSILLGVVSHRLRLDDDLVFQAGRILSLTSGLMGIIVLLFKG